ncbi:MAG: FliA/WhiG family RNA polymerase sigma factor [Acidobacteria bacterium]|nr:FliA/WhiG family RNA polymerase sigma factor [Acidobacteriota bacterium]
MMDTARHDDRNWLVVHHLSLVKSMAQRLARRLPRQVELTDLISVGVLGLIDAAGRYQPATGVPFDAFARQRIRGAMLDALRDLDWAPRSLRKLRRSLDTAITQLRHQLQREPTEDEIAAALALTPDEYAGLLDQLRGLDVCALRPLDGSDAHGTPILELCLDPDDGPEAQLERRELTRHLAEAIATLPARERQILALYYEEELTLAEIGAVIGVGESRVCQLRALAIARLRASMRDRLQALTARERA